MPAGDRTGPMGMGPMTGRGMGYCGGYETLGWDYWGSGRRFYGRGGRWGGPGFGRGGGGHRNRYYATGLPRWARDRGVGGFGYPPAVAYGAPDAPPSRTQEVEMLKDEAEWLKEQLNVINQRMDELSQE
jgi:hypothetical protein